MNRVNKPSFLFLILISSLINKARAHLEGENIIGGEDAKPGEYTYQVSLNQRFKSFCGGSIIGNQHVVTAAHCVTDKNGVLSQKSIQVVAGVNDLKNKDSRRRVDINVDTVYIPKKYTEIKAWNAAQNEQCKIKRSVGDIAVLKLAAPFDFESYPNLSKVKLGDPSKTYAGETAIVTGFGWNYVFTTINDNTKLVEESTGMSYDKMRFAKTNVISNEVCSELFTSDEENPVDDSHLCAHVVQKKDSAPQGVCLGDSGGPLVHNGDTLIGVVSTSPIGCHEDVKPAVYTRVSQYLDFIAKAVNNVADPQILSTHITNFSL